MKEPSAASRILEDVSVVVAEDNASTRRLLSEVLAAFGVVDLRMAPNGAEALEMIRLKAPHVVICDWHMEPMDGIDFLKALRGGDLGAASEVPAIMLTAHSKPELVKAAMDAGANHFVAKPIVPKKLLQRIVHVLKHDDVLAPASGRPSKTAGPTRRRQGRTASGAPIWILD